MEDFITFELAKKLKEKGFREDCIAKVNLDNTITFNHVFDNDIRTVLKCHNKLNPYVDAPTISQVLKWLREEKKIHIGISPQWQYTVYDMRCNPWIGRSDMQNYDDYTKAVIAGIEYVIDNLI